MLRTYKKLSIPTKLAMTVVVMLIPLGTLAVFLEMGFRYDIGIARAELSGTQCLREAFHIQHALANHKTRSFLNTTPAAQYTNLELETTDPVAEIDTSIKNIQAQLSGKSDNFGTTGSLAMSCIDATRLADTWKWYLSRPDRFAYEAMLKAVQALINDISNCAHLALDPALDSQMLARATVDNLPESCNLLAQVQAMALQWMRTTPPDTRTDLTATQRKTLAGITLLYRNGMLKPLLDDSAQALRSDADFYTASPTLSMNYGSQLEHYQRSANNFLETCLRIEASQAPPSELFNAASRTRAAGYRLFLTAMDEMDILLEKRIDGYQWWRMFGGGLSALGLLLAILFFIAASRSISQGLAAVVTYSREVAKGDYESSLDQTNLGPNLANMSANIQAMVETLKGKISYLDGVFRGMTIPCFVVDRDEIITYVNAPALRLAGMEDRAHEIIGQKLGRVVYEDETKQTISGRAMAENIPITNESVEYVSANGKLRYLRFDVSPLAKPNGDVIGAFAVITDMTPMVERESHIERLAAFPREAPDPVLSATEDGSILYRNTAASILLETQQLSNETDYLPERHSEIVERCLASGSDQHGLESKVGDLVFSWTYHPLPTQDIVHIYATDITKRIRAEKQLLHEAFHDTLTGLPNKALFMDRVSQAFRRARAHNTRFAILFLDLDSFKHINDALGHHIGDALLAKIAWRIQELLRPDETLARLGGDEFTILLPIVEDNKQVLLVADRIQKNLASHPFDVEGKTLSISASIGVINAPDGASNAGEMLRDAETAMYHAKSQGRGNTELFDSSMHTKVAERIQMENDLKHAIAVGEFEPYYQPIVAVATGRIAGFEALIRWHHPTKGLLLPGRFIPLAEETGLIAPMGAFMLETACRQAKEWHERYIAHRTLTMSVNMSSEQMTLPNIAEEIERIINHVGIATETVKIEITESGLMENVARASALLNALEDMGISLMIDDFGTGYSSLSHLHQFPFHFLKIDQMFVSTMEEKADNMEIVSSIISLAHSLGKRVVAEGVETKSQLDILTEFGCEFVQGYYFSHPVSAEEAENMLIEHKRW